VKAVVYENVVLDSDLFGWHSVFLAAEAFFRKNQTHHMDQSE